MTSSLVLGNQNTIDLKEITEPECLRPRRAVGTTCTSVNCTCSLMMAPPREGSAEIKLLNQRVLSFAGA